MIEAKSKQKSISIFTNKAVQAFSVHGRDAMSFILLLFPLTSLDIREYSVHKQELCGASFIF